MALPFVTLIAGLISGASGLSCPKTLPATAKSVAVSSPHLPRPKLFPLGEKALGSLVCGRTGVRTVFISGETPAQEQGSRR